MNTLLIIVSALAGCAFAVVVIVVAIIVAVYLIFAARTLWGMAVSAVRRHSARSLRSWIGRVGL